MLPKKKKKTYVPLPTPNRYEERLAAIREVVHCKSVVPVGNRVCKSRADLQAELDKVLAAGGEGLMLREPKSRYQHGRSWSLLKVKVMHDAEARVEGHAPGKGRHQGRMGGLECVLPNGNTFTVGTGFTDAQRNKPPKIGSVITFRYQELSDAGNPRFPTFQRVREDITWKDVCDAHSKADPPAAKVKVGLKERKHTLLYTSFSDGSSSSSATAQDKDKEKAAAVAAGDEAAALSTPKLMRRNTSIAESMTLLNKAAAKAAGDDDDDDDDDGGDGDYVPATGKRKADADDADGDRESGDRKRRATAAAATDGKKAWEVLYGDTGATQVATGSKPLCRYGARCFRKNKEHLARFTHPTPSGDGKATTTDADADAGAGAGAKTDDAKTNAATAAAEAQAPQQPPPSSGSTIASTTSSSSSDGAGDYVAQLVFVTSNSDPLPGRVVLGSGETVFGRGLFGLASPHLSRRHAAFRFDPATGELTVEPVGLNAVHVRERGDGDWAAVANETTHRLFPGDTVALLPDHSEQVKVFVAMV
jgi:hypothetical protein